jgi:ATP-binding cassette, subfamily C, bacteriocin exporter
MAGLIRGAGRIGLPARGIRAPADVLASIPKPAVAHLADGNGWMHYVVLYGATRGSVQIMDPAHGEVRRVSLEEFQRSWTGILLLVGPPQPSAERIERAVSPLLRFWRLAAPHRPVMVQAALGAVACTLLGLSTAIFVQKIVDSVIPAGNEPLLDLLGLAMLAMVVAQVYLGGVKDLLVLRTGQKIDAGLIFGYYQHLLQLPQRFFDTMRVGEIVSRVNDAVKIRAFVNETSLEILVNLLVVVFSFLLMSAYSWRLTALVGVSIPLYLLVYWLTNRANRRDQRRTMEAAADFEAHMVETIGAASTIRRLGLERHAGGGAETRLVRLLRPVYAVGRNAVLSGGTAELISRLTTIGLLWMGTAMVLRQALSAGELMSFYALHGHLTAPVLGLIAANRQVQDALVAADRLFEILDLERDADEGFVALTGQAFGTIQFRGLHFRYGTRPPLFQGLDLSIRRGELTALVGESGSGKSTLAALLQRLHTPEAGRILIGEIDIRDVRRESLLRSVAVVPQEVELFSGSILENLAPGVHEPDLARLLAITQRLGLREFLDSLPGGLQTRLGERGLALSGGQRQRIAIARALYRQPTILVLDEATSALDAVSEAAVYRTLWELQAEGATIVTITHRLTSARVAQRILVMDRGALVEEGNHGDLLARAGAYWRLWCHQTGQAGEPSAADAASPRGR